MTNKEQHDPSNPERGGEILENRFEEIENAIAGSLAELQEDDGTLVGLYVDSGPREFKFTTDDGRKISHGSIRIAKNTDPRMRDEHIGSGDSRAAICTFRVMSSPHKAADLEWLSRLGLITEVPTKEELRKLIAEGMATNNSYEALSGYLRSLQFDLSGALDPHRDALARMEIRGSDGEIEITLDRGTTEAPDPTVLKRYDAQSAPDSRDALRRDILELLTSEPKDE